MEGDEILAHCSTVVASAAVEIGAPAPGQTTGLCQSFETSNPLGGVGGVNHLNSVNAFSDESVEYRLVQGIAGVGDE